MSAAAQDLAIVVLVDVPVPLWSRAQAHGDELLREFALIAARLGEEDASDVPKRLTELVDTLNRDYSGIGSEQESRLTAAATAGVQVIPELVFHVPPAVGGAVSALGAMLDEADGYCRSGRHLLTLATPADLVDFRNWYLGEFTRQLAGEPPLPWGSYRPGSADGG